MVRLALAALVMVGCGPGKSTSSPVAAPLESHFPLAGASDTELCRTLGSVTRRDHQRAAGDPRLARRKVVISDLHLGPGSAQGSRFDGLEDFFAAAELGAMLRRLASRPTELIIAGDFIDFWQIEEAMGLLPPRPESGPVLATDQSGSLAALDVVLAAHAGVFADLAAFLASGNNRLVFIVGNHDGDLLWPRVQLAIARALEQRDLSRLAFVDREYRDRGVFVAHGHQLDPANKAGSAVVLDGDRCRLAASWGQVFVAKFLHALEQRFPFVDNLYPESAALMWGVGGEPDITEPLIAGYRFIDMLISEQSGELNLEALRATVLALFGAPDSAEGEGDERRWATVWDRMPGSESLWSALELLARDKTFTPLRDQLIIAFASLPDVDATLAAISSIDLGLISALKERVTTDPMAVAAAELLADDPSLRVVVFGHTHVAGGSVTAIDRGHYANSGTWTPIGKIDDLKKRGVSWTDLDLDNGAQFPRRLPAVVVDYEGDNPRPPHLFHAE